MMETMTMRQEMNLVLEHYSSGRLRDAEGLCREVLGIEAQHAEALHLLSGRHRIRGKPAVGLR